MSTLYTPGMSFQSMLQKSPSETSGNLGNASGAVRPSGPSQGFDSSYLQNLATNVGGTFMRPSGGLNFNPLGNLSDIKSPAMGGGNAPLPGLPQTLLGYQQSIT